MFGKKKKKIDEDKIQSIELEKEEESISEESLNNEEEKAGKEEPEEKVVHSQQDLINQNHELRIQQVEAALFRLKSF